MHFVVTSPTIGSAFLSTNQSQGYSAPVALGNRRPPFKFQRGAETASSPFSYWSVQVSISDALAYPAPPREAEGGQDETSTSAPEGNRKWLAGGRSRLPMARSPAGGTGPMHVPIGQMVANDRWRGSQLVQGMQGKVKIVFEDGLTPVDFYLSSRSCILYVTEADLVAGNGYRKKLVRVRNSSNLQGIVIVEKTQMSEQYYSAIQKFTVLDLGMVLLPVASQMEASCLIIQLVQEQTKEPSKNPFLSKKRAPIPELSLLRTVQQIPGVGKVKALLLLQKFPSIQQLSNASLRELEPVVGPAVAQHIQAFFTQPR